MSSIGKSKFKTFLKLVIKNRWIFRLIGIGLFILVLRRIDLKEAVQTLFQVDLRFLLLSLLIQTAATLVAATRWLQILKQLEVHIPFSRAVIYQFIGTSTALVTPGQLGEFIKVLYLKSDQVPVSESVLSVVMDRLLDLLMLFFFGFISVTILFGLSPTLIILLTTAGVIGVTFGFLFLRDKEKSAQWIAKVLERLSPRSYKETVRRDVHRLARKVGEFHPRFWLTVGMLTVLNYFLLFFRIYAIVLALHLNVPILYYMVIVPILRLVGLVPISVLGIGTRDVTSIYLLGRVGIPPSAAVVVSTLGLFTLQVQILVGLLFWWRFPLSAPRESAQTITEIPGQEVKATHVEKVG